MRDEQHKGAGGSISNNHSFSRFSCKAHTCVQSTEPSAKCVAAEKGFVKEHLNTPPVPLHTNNSSRRAKWHGAAAAHTDHAVAKLKLNLHSQRTERNVVWGEGRGEARQQQKKENKRKKGELKRSKG